MRDSIAMITQYIMIIVMTSLLSFQALHSQSLNLFDIDTTNYPLMKGKFYAFDGQGQQLNPSISEITLTENGIARTITNVSCPPPGTISAISSVLVIDVSGSMSISMGSAANIDLAKSAARAWVNGLPQGKSQCAITSFDHDNYLNQDFTSDKTKLLNAIDQLSPNGGTNYDAALLNPLAGGLLITKTGKYKKVIVLLTDGQASRPNITGIIAEANQQGCVIYCVTLGMPAPQSLKDIASGTGGQFFENVTSVQEAEMIYKKILNESTGNGPCTIEWQSKSSCNTGMIDVEMNYPSQSLSAKSKYNSSSKSSARLEFNPSSVRFTDPAINTWAVQKVMVTAKYDDFNVTDILINNGAFTIRPKSFSLRAGDSIELTIEYLPADSGYNYCRFDFINTTCQTKYIASGGWKGKKVTVRTLKLIQPNGGEVFVAGSDAEITWDGVAPDEPVRLEYRISDSSPWIRIADSAKGLKHTWRVPNTPSNNCLARVTSGLANRYTCLGGEVQICNQTWMSCNLDVDRYLNGDTIRFASSIADWIDAGNKKQGAWCYYDFDPLNGEVYGKLYNWYAVNDSSGLAPIGWRIPSNQDWKDLEICLGMSPTDANRTGGNRGTDQGSQIAGIAQEWIDGAMKSSANFGKSSFNAIPGGSCSANGDFLNLLKRGYWWSSSLIAPDTPIMRYIDYSESVIYYSHDGSENGFSVRCIKN